MPKKENPGRETRKLEIRGKAQIHMMDTMKFLMQCQCEALDWHFVCSKCGFGPKLSFQGDAVKVAAVSRR